MAGFQGPKIKTFIQESFNVYTKKVKNLNKKTIYYAKSTITISIFYTRLFYWSYP